MIYDNLKKLGGCKPKPPEFRFHASYLVHPSGCWLWRGRDRGSMGYGVIKVDGKLIPAHRYSWMLHRGEIPHGVLVCHKCDIPKCVNPEHLFLGNHQDNMDDCKRKGRTRGGTKTPLRGEDNPHSKLGRIDVLKILGDDRPNTQIAADYRVSATLIWRIKHRLTWRHVSG